MDIDLLFLGGYGHFVWPAFIFTFASCFLLYLKTSKELKLQEKKLLSEFNHLQVKEGMIAESKETSRKVLSGSLLQ